MGKPPIFVEPFRSPNLDHEKEAKKHAASGAATRITYIVIFVALVAVFLLVAIGLHIPAGE